MQLTGSFKSKKFRSSFYHNCQTKRRTLHLDPSDPSIYMGSTVCDFFCGRPESNPLVFCVTASSWAHAVGRLPLVGLQSMASSCWVEIGIRGSCSLVSYCQSDEFTQCNDQDKYAYDDKRYIRGFFHSVRMTY